MVRTVETKGAQTAAAIRDAALELIFRYGFEAMSLRQLAAAVGIQPASLYNHITSKQDLLFGLIDDHMTALLAETDKALAAGDQTAVGRLKAFVANHLLYHLGKQQDVYLANFELRALEPHHHKHIMGLRRAYEKRLIAILDDGVIAGVFDLRETHVAAYATLATLTGACTWYRPNGRLTKTDMVQLHLDLVLHGLRFAPARREHDPVALVGRKQLRSVR